MTKLYTRPLLSVEELEEIDRIILSAEWESHSSDSNVYLDAHQKNSEMVAGAGRNRISEITFTAISRDEAFRDTVFPKHSTGIIVSKTEVGQGFKIHHDMPTNGDVSTTIFLSDPATYSGGQLAMYMGGEERLLALPAGHAVTYDTGIPHCVKEVTKGVRYAIVFWTTSLIRDTRWREIMGDLRKAKKLLPRDYGYDLTRTDKDPHFLIQGVENKLLRYFLND